MVLYYFGVGVVCCEKLEEGLIFLTPKTSQVGVSLIIRKNNYDIGLFSVGYEPEGNGYKKGQKNSHSPIRNNFKITET